MKIRSPMIKPLTARCPNCGAAAPGGAAAVCPVCHLASGHRAAAQHLSRDDLERELSALITQARTSGLDTKTILLALSEELGFAAELGQVGRQFHVQVIDLGLSEGARVLKP